MRGRNEMRKILVFVLLAIMMFPTIAFANVNDDKEVKSVISQYFDNYFKSYQTLEIVNSDNIIEDNENTLLYKKMHEFSVEANKLIGLSYTTYKVNLDFQSISYSKNIANVDLLMNCDYVYSSTPDAKSSMGLSYKFCLIRENNEYKIISIDSNFDEFDNFKKSVEEKVSSSKISKRDAINITKEEKIQEIRDTVKYIAGNSANSEISPTDISTSPNEVIPLAVTSTFSYNRMLGRNYAERFAEESDLDARFFYTIPDNLGGDCTNFVSQCIWAAYGGYVEGSDTQTRNNITNRVRMVNNIWQAGTGGGVPNWESVMNLWTYATTNTGNGPKATGANNGQPYYNLSPSSIYYGNVIQKRADSTGDYTHSVFVTYSLDSSTQYYYQVLVSQHSGDLYNRNLWELITSSGGNNCYLRKMSFNSATFSS